MAKIETRDKIVSTTNSLQQLLAPVKIRLETNARVVPRYCPWKPHFFRVAYVFSIHYQRNDYCWFGTPSVWGFSRARHFCEMQCACARFAH
jgi:hypothetical protein